ncbi:hypothetical protein PFICI_02024 [Pestalotiopsis fici W106-1]|uniref:RING-type domain-containing protein n=1 Tax=Pestalotiopsis fici (strain W106-1 / CGMCC3.15140) TaxID=1229662 RepID=W3XSK4_PESFW|nr:uncharacterized protein PFICI_02024 [Pestalotiopsis fici W106-1]ETS88196.1 hypothetical protein PFICI_02024 [Pestalotiopsis fici W106-1]
MMPGSTTTTITPRLMYLPAHTIILHIHHPHLQLPQVLYRLQGLLKCMITRFLNLTLGMEATLIAAATIISILTGGFLQRKTADGIGEAHVAESTGNYKSITNYKSDDEYGFNAAHAAKHSLGDSPSDDDSESTDTAMITSDVLDDISAVAGPRARIRAAQMMRRAGVPQCGRKVASKKAIASLISVVPEDLPEEERSCIICYNDYGVETPEGIIESPLRLPKCQHVFGDHCIKKWLAESDSCPYCRDKLPSEPPTLHHRQEAVFHLMRQHASRHGESTDAGGIRTLGAHAYQHQDRRSPPIDNGEPRRRPRWRNRPSASSGRSNAPLNPVTGWALHYDTDPTRFGPSSHGQRHPMGPLGSPMTPRLPEGRNNQENNNPRFPGVHSFQSNEPGARLPFPNPLGATEMETAMGPSWASPRSGFLPYAVRNGPDNTVHQNGDNLPR